MGGAYLSLYVGIIGIQIEYNRNFWGPRIDVNRVYGGGWLPGAPMQFSGIGALVRCKYSRAARKNYPSWFPVLALTGSRSCHF
jgi:hypothetical protein